MKRETLNIFFVIDANYLVPFTVTLTSVLENNKDLDITVFVVHELEENEILDKSKEFFKNVYDIDLKLIKLEESLFNFKNFHVSHYITKTVYYKLILAELIPEKIEKGLYLDCDTIITGSLKEFLILDTYHKSEISVFAVPDIRGKREIERMRAIGVELKSYFNSGVMFINLKKWRKENASEKMIELGKKYNSQLMYHDQDILNIYFNNKKGDLDNKYNQYASKKYSDLPIILHYMGTSKPWQYIDNGYYKKNYIKYLKLTPFKDLKLEKITLEKVARKYVRLIKKQFGINEY